MESVTNQLYRDRNNRRQQPPLTVFSGYHSVFLIDGYITYEVQKPSLKRRIIGLHSLARFGYYTVVFWRLRVYFTFLDIVTF
jgi:hypothetical protein